VEHTDRPPMAGAGGVVCFTHPTKGKPVRF
jgi:hypothetical protein